jgi:predicted dehydrogenase
MRILQIGLGGFGRNHLRAWQEMGRLDDLLVAEMDQARLASCRALGMRPEALAADYHSLLDGADVVDIVTPSTSHFELCVAALEAGKDVFVEKPMTMTSTEAVKLAELAHRRARILQVGYYYRFHPLSAQVKDRLSRNDAGDVRYISGNFMGFKRARTDVGVTHTDAIHFIDLFNWWMGAPPDEVYAVVRDHWQRGMEDLSIALFKYPGGAMAKVESGYVQPGRWRDKVVPNAFTSKEAFVVGSRATAEVDFETETLAWHDVRHEPRDGTWWPALGGTTVPNVGTASPVQMIAAELADFFRCVEKRLRPAANVIGSGVVLARLMEALYESARANSPVALTWSTEERQAL